MTVLYNCHHDGDQYRITKFNELGEPESSYLCTETECECPAGVRPTCRHRQMLPKFLAREAIDSYWFYDFDRGGWVTNEPGLSIELRTQAEPANLRTEGAITGRWVSDGKHIDEDEVEIIEPMSHMGDGTPHLGGVYAKDVTPAPDPDDYGEDPIGLESLPPARPAWRRI